MDDKGIKVIPTTDEYRQNYDRIFGRRSSTVEQLPYKRQVEGPSPSGGTKFDQQPVRITGVLTNPFTGHWFGWVL
jgi:hypothetical protein